MLKGKAMMLRELGGEPAGDPQQAATAVDAGDVKTFFGEQPGHVAGTATDVEQSEISMRARRRKLERLNEFEADVGFRASGEFSRVVAGADFEEEFLEWVAEDFFDVHRPRMAALAGCRCCGGLSVCEMHRELCAPSVIILEDSRGARSQRIVKSPAALIAPRAATKNRERASRC